MEQKHMKETWWSLDIFIMSYSVKSLGLYSPSQELADRISAEEAIDHEWFREVPLPKSKEFMPTFPAQHARDR
ncbi:cyclin-dependent kinase G-2-like isoform X1 [Cucumis melo var. makuwa]|uniref:Cyclin-dependent kinase G-2-like isoform X1 n=1 Tax=Cucumis melo var. makuwa TaxID=1194695 RepID=A0A5A7UAK5_CUCMM|nr:cyclin-dependent kinase G-2-like isoform X1 [Cucumis melo var. makuwa]